MIVLLALISLMQPPSPLKALSTLASSLSEGNPAAAIGVLDKSMSGYETISANIYALTSQADLTCSIDAVEQNGNEIEADWFFLIRSKQESGPTERRQVKVKITLAQVGKNWKIKAIDPPSILDPPQ